jgi:restriction endonuclease S subunit
MDLANYTTGLGTTRISDFDDLELYIPSKEIQEEIVKELDEINEKINQQEKTNIDLKNDIQRVWNLYLNKKE